MSLLDFITGSSEQKKKEKAWKEKCKQDAAHWHTETRRYPIRMIFPMPNVQGSVSGGGYICDGKGSLNVSGHTYTKYGLMVFYETETGAKVQILDQSDVIELVGFTDEESHVIVRYMLADSDNRIIDTFYDAVYLNRHWQQPGR